MSPKKVAIIILNWNGLQDTLECLTSLQQLRYRYFKIFLADNGSTDHSLSKIGALFPDVHLIDNKENLGFAEGNNRAILVALEQNFDCILLLNNDTTVDPHLLDAFLNLHALYPTHILGAQVHLFARRDLLDHLGGLWNSKKAAFDLIGYREQASLYASSIELDYVTGCCLFASKEVFHQVGFLDPRFFLYWEESDFCQRAKRLGIFCRSCPEAHIYHKVSASFVGGKPHAQYFFWRNRFLFTEKNLAKKEQFFIWLTIFSPEILKMARHYLLVQLQLFFALCLRKNSVEKKRQHLLLIQASLCGVKDYLLRRFYQGPSWIFKKN